MQIPNQNPTTILLENSSHFLTSTWYEGDPFSGCFQGSQPIVTGRAPPTGYTGLHHRYNHFPSNPPIRGPCNSVVSVLVYIRIKKTTSDHPSIHPYQNIKPKTSPLSQPCPSSYPNLSYQTTYHAAFDNVPVTPHTHSPLAQ